MVQQITENVSVQVEVFYQAAQSNPINNEYLFAYRITIANLGGTPVQLQRRHWYIVDGNGTTREVEGEGVVGQTPVLQAGAEYQYISAASLRSDMGKMYGTYQMENLFSKERFTVSIPEFQMIPPFKMN